MRMEFPLEREVVMRREKEGPRAALGWGMGPSAQVGGLATARSTVKGKKRTQADTQVGLGVVVGTLRSSPPAASIVSVKEEASSLRREMKRGLGAWRGREMVQTS